MSSMIQYGQYKVPNSTECIALNVGQPSNLHLPIVERNIALNKILNLEDPSSLQYGKIEGYDNLRIDFAKFLSQKYTEYYNTYAEKNNVEKILLSVNSDDIIMTNGNTGGLMLLLSLFSRTNMTIFVEDPTYFLALDCFKNLGLNIVPIRMTPEGLDLNQLKIELAKLNGQNCLLYMIPINQNPTGYTITESNKIKLSMIADKNPNLLVFADEVYHMLTFENNNYLFPMCYYNKNFISMGSFSKIFAPALRMGWIHCLNKRIIKLITSSGQLDSSGCVNPLGCQIVHELIKENLLNPVIARWNNFLSTNCEMLYRAIIINLADHIENITKPNGGYFIWIEFKSYVRTMELSDLAEQYKIKFHYGNKFSVSKTAGSCVRLSFSWYTDQDYQLFTIRMKNLIEENCNWTSAEPIEQIEPIKPTESTNLIQNKYVYVQGHNGKLGKLITEKIRHINQQSTTNIIFGGVIERNSNLEFINENSVIIDVSSAEGTKYLLETLLHDKKYCPVVIGTTGNLPTYLINEYAKYAPIAISANFSKGINQLRKMINVIDKNLWKPFLSETHHTLKKDAPSGTAKLIANWYGNNEISLNSIESVREGNIIGEHHLILDNDSEYIKISHVAKTRELFADGSINWIKFIVQQQPGLYTTI